MRIYVFYITYVWARSISLYCSTICMHIYERDAENCFHFILTGRCCSFFHTFQMVVWLLYLHFKKKKKKVNIQVWNIPIESQLNSKIVEIVFNHKPFYSIKFLQPYFFFCKFLKKKHTQETNWKCNVQRVGICSLAWSMNLRKKLYFYFKGNLHFTFFLVSNCYIKLRSLFESNACCNKFPWHDIIVTFYKGEKKICKIDFFSFLITSLISSHTWFNEHKGFFLLVYTFDSNEEGAMV